MNSQQELLDAINTISQSRDRSCDTPATVLRVEGDTVWVHIDGGADETPVLKTINCSEGETVQVRISNGNAFLVGNASAPPTDDKTANAAHFIAEEADVKATEAIKTANAIVQTVQGKVDSGNSNISVLSSTMYQNEYGVNIYNDDLAVGDSYAHIDGDSFDIKEATTAGTIDDANDKIVASFGENSYIQSRDAVISSLYYKLYMASDSIKLASIETSPTDRETGWKIDGDKIVRYGDIYSGVLAGIDASTGEIYIQDAAGVGMGGGGARIDTNGHAKFYYDDSYGTVSGYTEINQHLVTIIDEANEMYYKDTATGSEWYIDNKTEINAGDITIAGNVFDSQDNKVTPTIMKSPVISASATSFTFTHPAIKADSVIDIYDTIFNFNATNAVTVNGSCTITFPAQSSSHSIKLFVY